MRRVDAEFVGLLAATDAPALFRSSLSRGLWAACWLALGVVAGQIDDLIHTAVWQWLTGGVSVLSVIVGAVLLYTAGIMAGVAGVLARTFPDDG